MALASARVCARVLGEELFSSDSDAALPSDAADAVPETEPEALLDPSSLVLLLLLLLLLLVPIREVDRRFRVIPFSSSHLSAAALHGIGVVFIRRYMR